jgi:hypothetical protein
MTGIVVALVGVAYFWGVPLIQKRSSMSEFSTMERFIDEVQQSIVELARTGAGEVSLNVNDAWIKLLPYNSGNGNNSMIIAFALEQPLMFPNTTFYLGATSFEDINDTGVYGESSPSVVTLRENSTANYNQIDTEIIYRELLRQDPPRRGYIIALCPKGDAGCDDVITGNQRITLSFDRTVNMPGQASNGGDLVVTYINVNIA